MAWRAAVAPWAVGEARGRTAADKVVEDIGLIEIARVALAQVEMVVELADARGHLADLPALQPAVRLEQLPMLLLALPQLRARRTSRACRHVRAPCAAQEPAASSACVRAGACVRTECTMRPGRQARA